MASENVDLEFGDMDHQDVGDGAEGFDLQMPANIFAEAGAPDAQQVQQDAQRMDEHLRQILVGPSRNIFEHQPIKDELFKPIEVLNRAQEGKYNAKNALNNSDKERIDVLKRQIAQKKSLVTAWMLKRQSLLSRFEDTRLHKFVFAKFVLKQCTYANPTLADIFCTFSDFTQMQSRQVRMAIAHFVELHLAIVHGMPEYLHNNRAYVEKMTRISAASNNQAEQSIVNALTIKRLAYKILLDCFLADYYDFKFDVVIDHNDQMSHYDIQRLNSRLGQNGNGAEGPNAHSVARQHLDGILDIVGQNGGNREAVLVDIFSNDADEWDANSFVRDLINVRMQNVQNPVDDISSENDATLILMHYMAEPKDFDPLKTGNIIQARINRQWYRYIELAKNQQHAGSIQLLNTLPAPTGLMSYQQALKYIAKRYEGNEKFWREATDSGIVNDVVPFPFILQYAMLSRHIAELEANGQQQTEDYAESVRALQEMHPDYLDDERLQNYSKQYHDTVQQFIEAGVAHEQFAQASMTEAGSAVHCFPDNCENTQDAALITPQIVAYLDLVDSLHRTEEAIKSGSSFATSSIEELKQKMTEMINGPSIDDLHQNDANYFEKHHDAPWVGQVEDDIKVKLYRLSSQQAEMIKEQQERDVEKTFTMLAQSGRISEADQALWKSKLELAFQRKPEDFIVQGHLQTIGADGKTKQIKVQYISPDVKSHIKAAKMTENTPIKWSIIAESLWKVVCKCAEDSLSRPEEEGTWSDHLELDKRNLLNAVTQVLRPDYWHLFAVTLLTDVKTSLAAEQRASQALKNSKKRKRCLTPNLVSDDIGDHGQEGEEHNIIREMAKKGKLVIGAPQKKKPIVYIP